MRDYTDGADPSRQQRDVAFAATGDVRLEDGAEALETDEPEPVHFAQNGNAPELDEIELDSAEAVVVDITTGEPRIELADVEGEPRDGRIWLDPFVGLIGTTRWKLRAKRVLDVVVALLALLVLSPLILVTALAVKLTSPGPVLYASKRIGQDGIPFVFFKFRSMRNGAHEVRGDVNHLNEADGGPIFKIRKDPRLTPIGKVLRKSSIDELPQLMNVLRGDMSLVGTRPPIPEEVVEYGEWELQRLFIKPGITGIWQVSGRSEIPFNRWVEMDLTYIRDWSLWLDLKILLKTIPAVLSGRGAY